LLARANEIAPGDRRLYEAARDTGADVPVCLDPRPRVMRGIGEILSAPVPLPRLSALLVNPGVAVPTKSVFAGWKPAVHAAQQPEPLALAKMQSEKELLDWLAREPNDLEAPAIALAPAIADVLAALRGTGGCRLARMSGSGATCFALFSSGGQAAAAAKSLRAQCPGWWIAETVLG
jgi:4-diphosphocytidyl-2-C-methyl-D-erythritol kinase